MRRVDRSLVANDASLQTMLVALDAFVQLDALAASDDAGSSDQTTL
jgi:hypothetical protein